MRLVQTLNVPIASEELRERIRELVDSHSARAVANAYGTSEATILRVYAGLPVRAGSVALLERYVANVGRQEAKE